MKSEFACLSATSLRHHPAVDGAIPVANGETACRSWNVLRYLASGDRAEFQVGVGFVQRTFLLCVCCFGVTCLMTAALLAFEAAAGGSGRSRLLYDDVCSSRTNWSCTQWLVDAVLVGVVIPIKFWRGWLSSYTLPMLVLLDVFQSANLALIGCASSARAPLCLHTFICFEAALITVWLCSMYADPGALARRCNEPPETESRSLDHSAACSSERQPLTPDSIVQHGYRGASRGLHFQWANLVGAGAISCVASSCVLLICKSKLDWLPIASKVSDGAHVCSALFPRVPQTSCFTFCIHLTGLSRRPSFVETDGARV